MPAPVLVLYRDDSVTLLDAAHDLDFGVVDKGTITPVQTVHLWNDKGGVADADTAVAPHFYALNAEDASILFAGTTLNGNVSMVEARSCAATNTPADQHEEWTPIGPTQILTLGDMPLNSLRTLEVRINVPTDAATLAAVSFTLRASA